MINAGEAKAEDKIDNLEDAIQKIRQKYGMEIIKPGISVKKEKPE